MRTTIVINVIRGIVMRMEIGYKISCTKIGKMSVSLTWTNGYQIWYRWFCLVVIGTVVIVMILMVMLATIVITTCLSIRQG